MGPEVLLYIQIAAILIRCIKSDSEPTEVEVEEIVALIPDDVAKKIGNINVGDVRDLLEVVRFIGKVLGK